MSYDSRHYYPPRPSHDPYYNDPRSPYDDSAEDIPRAYPPGTPRYEYDDYGYPPRHPRISAMQEGVRRSRSTGGGGGRRSPSYEYEGEHRPRHRHRRSKHHDRHRRPRHSSPSPSRSPPRHRRKSLSEHALGALGLGSAASHASPSRHHDSRSGRSRSHRHRSYSQSPSPTRSRHHLGKSEQQIAQAARAAIMAGAVEAFRVRKEPGDWKGDKGKRILTAAVTAGGTDGLMDRGGDPKHHSKRHMIESTLAGLATNRLVNGSRSRSRHGRRSDSRGRSSSHSGMKKVATTGLLAAAGKEAYDHFKSRSRSRSRGRGRSSSRDSYEEDSPRHRGSKKRSKSVSDYISHGLAALGLEDGGGGGGDRRRDRRSRHEDDHEYSDDSQESDYSPPRRRRRRRDSRDSGADEGEEGPEGNASDSDVGNSSDEQDQRKKIRRNTMLATGLATASTIHAANSVYTGVEKRKKRQTMLEEGTMTAEEARRRKVRGTLGDAASVGIAAAGIKAAVSGWKRVDEKRKESNAFQRESRARAARRERSRGRSQGAAVGGARWPDEIEDAVSDYGYGYGYGGRSAPRRISF